MADLAFSTVAQGLMWSILAIGVFLSFRVLDVPDMTCEGSSRWAVLSQHP